MESIWKKIPNEIIHIILQYEPIIKYRNGVYINQIQKNDYRYNLLLTIPKIEYDFDPNWQIYVKCFVYFPEKESKYRIYRLIANDNQYCTREIGHFFETEYKKNKWCGIFYHIKN